MSAHRPFAGALPYGVRDLFLEEAAQLAALEDTWRRLFESWAYVPVIPPTYELYDVLLVGSGVELEQQVFRVLDREGNILALRSDLTTQVARIVGTKLADQPSPLRFYYQASVYRYEEPQAGREREFRQAGIELIGAAGAEADSEVLIVAIEALRRAGLRRFRINLGHLGVFRALAAEAALPSPALEAVRAALNRKDSAGLCEALEVAGVTDTVAAPLQRLPALCGGPEVLVEAERLATHSGLQAAVRRLAAIHETLSQRGLAEHVIFDLGDTRGMDYYTGIAFEGFAPGLGFPLCGGGRYDELIGRYGAPRPAVGAALLTERVRLALNGACPAGGSPDLLVSAAVASACWREIEDLRALGWRVEVDVLDRDEAALREAARASGSRTRVALAAAEGRVLVLHSDETRWLTWRELQEARP